MRRMLRAAWAWSWVVTVPVAALFAAWCVATWRHVRALAHDPVASAWPAGLHDIGADCADHLLRQLLHRLRPSDITDVPEPSQLRSIQLFVNDREQDKLDCDLPYSGFDWANARLAYGDGLHKVDLRHRGDTFVHWGYDKKSLRVRTASNDLFAGLREFHLMVPRFPLAGDTYLAYRLAKTLGLMTPRCELVNVFLNGRLLGVMEFTERLDEGTLRAHGRMPGDLYAGELRRRDARRGSGNRLFDLPLLWEKLAENGRCPAGSRAPLEELCRVLALPQSEAAHTRLGELLDMEAWGRFGAFEVLAQTQGCDEAGNWRLYWDPWRCRFEPVVQDPAGWADALAADAAPVRLDAAPSRLHGWLLANGRFLAARHKALQDFFANKHDAFLSEVRATADKLGHALHHDPDIHPADEAVVQQALRELPLRLARVFETIRTEHLVAGDELAWALAPDGAVRVQVIGRAPIDTLTLRFPQALATTPVVMVSVQHADGVHAVEVPAASVLDDTLQLEFGACGQLAPAPGANAAGARPCVPATFDIRLVDGPPEAPLSVVASRGVGVAEVPRVDDLPVHVHDGLFAALPAFHAPAPQRWSGEVAIDGVQSIAADVHIEPGTIVRLGPKASVLFHGEVFAEGTAERPIRFVQAIDDQDPWGAVALDGPRCRGSVLRHCEFRGGSGHEGPLAQYIAMVSVHDCEQIAVSDCWFGDNHHYDALVHLVYADAVFERATFVGAHADALACDLSTAVVRDCTFVRPGNDGITLLATKALVEGCRFEGGGDQGLAIGDGSRAVVLRCTFDGCSQAMQVKDGAFAHALHCEVRRCTGTAEACRKNGRHAAGGALVLQRSVLAGNGSLPTADHFSRLELVDCTVVGELPAEYDQEHVDGTKKRMRNTARAVDCDASPRAKRNPPAFPEELAPLQALAGDAWRAACRERRGLLP